MTGIRKQKRLNLNRSFELFYFPLNWDFFVLQSLLPMRSIIRCFSPFYSFSLPVPPFITLIKYDNFSRTIYFFYAQSTNFYKPLMKWLTHLFNSFILFFFKKLKFKGKGYYIFKNKRNTITFRFGYSHRIYLYFYGSCVKFLSKTSIFIFGINRREIINYGHALVITRPYNLFTGKGVRFTRQILYKKVGKVGSYR